MESLIVVECEPYAQVCCLDENCYGALKNLKSKSTVLFSLTHRS